MALLRLSRSITWRVSLLLLLVMACAECYGRVTRRSGRRTQDAVAALGRVSSEALQLLRTLRALSAEAWHLRLFREQNELIGSIQRERGLVLGIFSGASNGLAVLLQLVSLCSRAVSWRFHAIWMSFAWSLVVFKEPMSYRRSI